MLTRHGMDLASGAAVAGVGLFEISISLVSARFLWLIVGLLSLVVGFVLLGNPAMGATALMLVIGVFAIVWGIILLVEALSQPEITQTWIS